MASLVVSNLNLLEDDTITINFLEDIIEPNSYIDGELAGIEKPKLLQSLHSTL